MRTALALDDTLVAKAQALTGLTEKSALVREALKAFNGHGQREIWFYAMAHYNFIGCHNLLDFHFV